MAKTKETKKGVFAEGDEVVTPDGEGKVTAVKDDKISVKFEKTSGQFAPRYVSHK